jgi:hypothetical protein
VTGALAEPFDASRATACGTLARRLASAERPEPLRRSTWPRLRLTFLRLDARQPSRGVKHRGPAMAIWRGGPAGRSPAARPGAGPRIFIDRTGFLADPSRRVGEKTAVTVAAVQTEIVSPGVARRTVTRRRVICSADGLLMALMTALVGLLLAGLPGTQALAHEGHGATADAFAPQTETAAAMDEAAPSAGGVARCEGHCCVSGACCLGVAGPCPAALPEPGAPDANSQDDADAMPSAAPEGPRRPPRRAI